MPISFHEARLPNGLTILAEVDPHAHTAAAGFFVKTGARDEAPELMGVSHFLEHMMFKGTPTRTAEQVNEQFDDLGASHNAFTTSELTAFWAHTLPEVMPAALDILADILRPSLRSEDFEEERGVILEEIAMYEDQPFWVVYERAMEHAYRNHPLQHRVLGVRDTISGLTRDQMAAYFENRYSADNTVLALAGKLDFDRMVVQAERLCGHWQTTRPSGRTAPGPLPTARFEFSLPNVTRCYSLLFSQAPAIQSHDRYPMSMAAHILGDSEGSRLYWSLIEPGLAEEAQSQYDGRDGCGESLVFFVCSPDAADKVEEIVRREIERLAESLTEDDLERARSKFATAITIAGERPAGRMRRLGQIRMYLDDYRSLEDELDEINRVTVSDLREAIERNPMQPSVVGRLVPG